MLFNSFQFALFFPIVTILYFVLPFRLRAMMLLAASAIFYMAFVPSYILILVGTIAVDYCAGLLIDGATGSRRRLWLMLSLVANVGVLAFFKYFDFVNDTVRAITLAAGHQYPISGLDILLPIGLSFQ